MSDESNSITSPVLLALRQDKLPDPLPACAGCAAAVWHVSEPALRCYCRLMHLESWTSIEPQPLLACDGQVISAREAAAKESNHGAE